MKKLIATLAGAALMTIATAQMAEAQVLFWSNQAAPVEEAQKVRDTVVKNFPGGVDFEPEDRVFFMFGSANRDEDCFENPDRFDITRDTQKSIAFGAGPHYCAGAFASRAMVADIALPSIFARLRGLRLDETEPVRIGGWAFRGLLNLPVKWEAN